MRRRTSPAPFSLFAFQDIITSVTGILILVTLLIALELVNRRKNAPQHQTVQLNQMLRKQLQATKSAIGQLDQQLHQQQGFLPDAVLAPDVLKSKLQALKERGRQEEQKSRELARQLAAARKRLQNVQQVRADHSGEVAELQRLQQDLRKKTNDLSKLTKTDRLLYNVSALKTASSNPWLIEVTATSIRAARMGRRAPPLAFAGNQAFEAWARTQPPSTSYFLVLLRPDSVKSYRVILDFLDKQGFRYGYDLVGTGKVVIDATDGAGF